MPAESRAILVDANLVIWAHHRAFAEHEAARAWWADAVSRVSYVGIPWPTILAFLRVSTHRRALERPIGIADAWATAADWLERANVHTPVPGERHPAILGDLLIGTHAVGNHSSDAHMAALAIEWGLELCSSDRDFARYPGLRWRDPIATD